MKTLNHYLKILSILLLLATFSCEDADKNNFIETSLEKVSEVEQKRNSTNIRTVNIDEIPLVGSRIKTVMGKDVFSKTKKNGDPIIDDLDILEITDSLNRRNYSFSMLVKEEKYKGPRLYNLIVGVDSTGRVSDPMVLRFKPQKEYEQEWLDNDLDLGHFTGKVSLHKYKDFFKDNPLAAIGELCPPEHDEYGDPIICVEDDISPGGSGGGSSTDGGSFVPAGGGGGGSPTSCNFNYYWNYCGGTNEDIPHGPGTCGGDGGGAGWVLEIDCPEYSTSVYFLEGKGSDCPNCETGPSGDMAVNNYAKSVIKLEASFSILNYELSHSELTWLNLNDHIAYELMQPIKNDGWAPETINVSLLNLFREMANDGWISKSGTVGNRAALKYTHYYEPNWGESMYLLENGLVLYQSQSERRINKKLEGTISSTEPPTNGYNYIFNPSIQKWYEFRMPSEDYTETDLNFLFDKFWDGAKFVGRYMVPVEDVIIMIDGKDWDGVEQSRVETAGWFMVGLIPGGKALKPVTKIVSGISKYRKIVRVGAKSVSLPSINIINGIVDFGSESYNRTKLREVLQLVTGDGKHAHHIIPWEFRGNALVQKAAKSDKVFHISEKVNGFPLPSSNHLTGHKIYNNKIQSILTTNNNAINNMNPNEAYAFLHGLIAHIDDLLKANPSKNIGELANLISYP